jgi:hypothetical protein
MKISELVAALNDYLETEGDIPVVLDSAPTGEMFLKRADLEYFENKLGIERALLIGRDPCWL